MHTFNYSSKAFNIISIGLCVIILILVNTFGCADQLETELKLNTLISENAVFQRYLPIPIWGEAAPGEKLVIKFHNQTKVLRAGTEGSWEVYLDAESEGGPYILRVLGNHDTISISNILIGEVWICSGQSNMAFKVKDSAFNSNDIANSNNPLIRHIKIPYKLSELPLNDFGYSKWELCTPENVENFSAAGYFFARYLYSKLHVPIGIINSSHASTNIEAWISHHGLSKLKDYQNIRQLKSNELDQLGRTNYDPNDYPSLLFNGMIHPILNYGFQGVIWYQGESNIRNAYQYRTTFPALINDWRRHAKTGNFPFIFVQLPNYKGKHGTSASGSRWAELREAQAMALYLPNTGMAVTIDIGDENNIHPLNKQEVGKRLALSALKIAYKKDIPFSGPLYDTMTIIGNKVVIKFKHTEEGFMVLGNNKTESLVGFEIAGSNKIFHPAYALIQGATVVVWSDRVVHPIAVRYGWADNPQPRLNLYNSAGLPCSPFRTDDFKSVTKSNKYKQVLIDDIDKK